MTPTQLKILSAELTELGIIQIYLKIKLKQISYTLK